MIATTTRQASAPPRRWWSPRPRHHDRPAEVLAVLQHAREIVEAGWVQSRWTVSAAPSRTGAAGDAGGRTGTAGDPTDRSVRACVVAAVALAVRARDPRADLAVDTGPALAYLWDEVFGGQVAGRSAPHHVRVARMRELARWNDERVRTRDEVVAALDRAAARVVARVVEPARA
jgi:hypothetical protein